MDFANKRVAIIGLGIEGKDVLRFMTRHGAIVSVFDKQEKEKLDLSGDTNTFQLITGDGYLASGLSAFDIIIRSPGIRPDIPEFVEARNSGVQITSAVNIFFSLCPCPIIGVTGTKGKGTTASFIYESLKASGLSAYLAGNIGTPYLELLARITKEDIIVLELSSFQLIDIEKSPHVAVILNLTEDHLDWHTTKEEYIESKKRIVSFQKNTDYAILAYDYPVPRSFKANTQANVYYFSKEQKVRGSYIENGNITIGVGKQEIVGAVTKLLLRGKHNWENATAAALAARLSRASLEGIRRGLFSFTGLPHRLEFVATVNGISFYDDSIATNPEPVLAAVDSFNEPVILILGGSSKGLSYRRFSHEITRRGHVKAAVVIGQTGPEIKNALQHAGFNRTIVKGGTTMGSIVSQAYGLADNGDVVILSPASASFDMFKNYKDRGDQFKTSVERLQEQYGEETR